MRKMRKITRDKKGIDTILAALLMVVIVVVAAVMVYAWSTGLLSALLVQNPVPKESLTPEFTGFNSVYNMTVNLRNTGAVAVTLSSYYVKDSSGNNQYARTSWSTGPNPQTTATVINPNQVGVVFVLIGTGGSGQCGSGCTVSGTAFTFQPGSYTVTVVTSRNNQFVINAQK